MVISVNLPQIVKFDDDHDIDEMVHYINKVTITKVKGKEIGFDGTNYIGIIYHEVQPKKSEIDALLLQNNIKLNTYNNGYLSQF